MRQLIKKYGCILRTIFELGNTPQSLAAIEDKFEVSADVERMLNMVGGASINHDIASGSFLHV
jgi:hypothetical protein